MIRSSIRLSFTSPLPVCMMYTSSPRTLSPISTHVSRFENFFVTTLPGSMPNLSHTLLVRSAWLLPLNTLMLGILLPLSGPSSQTTCSAVALPVLAGCKPFAPSTGQLLLTRQRRWADADDWSTGGSLWQQQLVLCWQAGLIKAGVATASHN